MTHIPSPLQGADDSKHYYTMGLVVTLLCTISFFVLLLQHSGIASQILKLSIETPQDSPDKHNEKSCHNQEQEECESQCYAENAILPIKDSDEPNLYDNSEMSKSSSETSSESSPTPGPEMGDNRPLSSVSDLVISEAVMAKDTKKLAESISETLFKNSKVHPLVPQLELPEIPNPAEAIWDGEKFVPREGNCTKRNALLEDRNILGGSDGRANRVLSPPQLRFKDLFELIAYKQNIDIYFNTDKSTQIPLLPSSQEKEIEELQRRQREQEQAQAEARFHQQKLMQQQQQQQQQYQQQLHQQQYQQQLHQQQYQQQRQQHLQQQKYALEQNPQDLLYEQHYQYNQDLLNNLLQPQVLQREFQNYYLQQPNQREFLQRQGGQQTGQQSQPQPQQQQAQAQYHQVTHTHRWSIWDPVPYNNKIEPIRFLPGEK